MAPSTPVCHKTSPAHHRMSSVNAPTALVDAAAANLVAHFGYAQARVPTMRIVQQPDLVAVDCGWPCDTFNAVCRTRLRPERVRARIEWTLGWFGERDHPWSWWVGPADTPADLPEHLAAAGLAAAERELVMAVPLDEASSAPAAADLRIREVRTPKALAYFAQINAEHWTPPDPYVIAFYEAAARVLLDAESPLRFFVGYCGAEPVATVEITTAAGVIGVYNVSTLAPFRRRGFATAMVASALQACGGPGVTHAVLQAAPAGVSVYERLGFRAIGEVTEFKPTG